MKKKLLITGSGGFVAGSAIFQAIDNWHVYRIDRQDTPGGQKNINFYSMDLNDRQSLEDLFNQIQPDAVIHTAALADIDFCQSHHEEAEKINIKVTQNLANLCIKIKARLIFCSTDTVFDGLKGFYDEEDEPGPVNFYAETKIRAEKIIKEKISNAVIARLSLVMGLPIMGRGNSFLARTIEKLTNGEKVKFPENEIRTPIDVITTGRALVELAGNDYCGILHLSGNDRITRYEMAQRIVQRLGYSPDMITPTNSNAMPGRAPRPDDVSLNNAKARETINTPMQSLSDGLELILKSENL
jgi:dTDP-4-dehydrorhamnose reductase